MTGDPGATFVLEVGTEEIPDRMLGGARRGLHQELARGLEGLGLLAPGAASRSWATPRRLAVEVRSVRGRQEDREEMVTGPPSRAAFDAQGNPTAAARGFARAQRVPLEDLLRLETPKGEYVAVRRRVEGRGAGDLLAELLPAVIAAQRFPKMMTWGTHRLRFVRPIRWLVALLDGEVVPFEIAGVRSGRITRGPRYRGSPAVTVASASTYLQTLREAGVEPDPDVRREAIRQGLDLGAAAAGGALAPDGALLEIVTSMTEAPGVIHGGFPADYLDLPREVLVTVMRHHQRFFSVTRDEALLPVFLAVLDRPNDPDGSVRRGNEWVLRARLADARFFWSEDARQSLAERRAALERVIFQEKLGSYAAKATRLERLVGALGDLLGCGGEVRAAATRAAQLAKCDLTTEMVKEFPELQGVIGGLYARRDGEPEAVAGAIHDHYRPGGGGDALPDTEAGRLLALADRLDTLAGYFLLGEGPTGTRDPFALRRAGLGVARLLMENPRRLSLGAAVEAALAGQPAELRQEATEAREALLVFLRERGRFLSQGWGHRYDSIAAVFAAQGDDLREARLRLEALTSLRADAAHAEAFLSLAASFKRIRNLVKDGQGESVDPAALVEAPEHELHRALSHAEDAVTACLGRGDYLGALREIAGLRPAVDGFLGSSRDEGVLVMAPDPKLRRNRLGLLGRAERLFTAVADFGEIVVEGGAATADAR